MDIMTTEDQLAPYIDEPGDAPLEVIELRDIVGLFPEKPFEYYSTGEWSYLRFHLSSIPKELRESSLNLAHDFLTAYLGIEGITFKIKDKWVSEQSDTILIICRIFFKMTSFVTGIVRNFYSSPDADPIATILVFLSFYWVDGAARGYYTAITQEEPSIRIVAPRHQFK